ncbi:MAG: hypothetical protein ACFFDI_15760 [Promethearchaeota archaeon]
MKVLGELLSPQGDSFLRVRSNLPEEETLVFRIGCQKNVADYQQPVDSPSTGHTVRASSLCHSSL